MIVFFAYYSLLALWLLLLWPAIRLSGWPRLWIIVVMFLGATAALYEAWAHFIWLPQVVAPIRLDILLISFALSLFYASALLVLFAARWRGLASVLCIALVAASGSMAYVWVSASQESKRLHEVFRQRDKLLFEAKFRNAETYAAYFGPLDATSPPHPVGHWKADEGSRFTRLTLNSRGRAWLFYRCGTSECHYGSDEATLRPVSGEAPGWDVVLEKRALGEITLRIEREEPDRLRLMVQDQHIGLERTAPPIDPDPSDETLNYLGTFLDVECRRHHAWVRQLWLWRNGSRLYAVAIFALKPAGMTANYVSPVLLGEARSADGVWNYAWQQHAKNWTAQVSLADEAVSLALTQSGQDPVGLVLSPGQIFRDEAIELAARESGEDWTAWFETILVGHFSSGDLPACPQRGIYDDDSRS